MVVREKWLADVWTNSLLKLAAYCATKAKLGEDQFVDRARSWYEHANWSRAALPPLVDRNEIY